MPGFLFLTYPKEYHCAIMRHTVIRQKWNVTVIGRNGIL